MNGPVRPDGMGGKSLPGPLARITDPAELPSGPITRGGDRYGLVRLCAAPGDHGVS